MPRVLIPAVCSQPGVLAGPRGPIHSLEKLSQFHTSWRLREVGTAETPPWGAERVEDRASGTPCSHLLHRENSWHPPCQPGPTPAPSHLHSARFLLLTLPEIGSLVLAFGASRTRASVPSTPCLSQPFPVPCSPRSFPASRPVLSWVPGSGASAPARVRAGAPGRRSPGLAEPDA